MSARRRNGQQSSCEPCRKMKLRCDHVLPVCGRCSQKGQSDQCIYHPAPLTRSPPPKREKLAAGGDTSLPAKKRKHQSSSSFSIKRGPTDYLQQYRISPAVAAAAASPAGNKNEQQAVSLEEGKAKPPKKSAGFSTGFLGPSSYWSAFEEPEENTGNSNNSNSNSNSRILAPTPASSSEQATDAHTVDFAQDEDMESTSVNIDQIEAGAKILTLLEDLPLYQTLIQSHYKRHRPWVFGERVTSEVFTELVALRHRWVPEGAKTKNYKSKLRPWSKYIFDCSAAAISCHGSMTPSEYYSGITPRWETIGLMFSWVGLAVTCMPDDHECLRLEHGIVIDRHELRAIIIEVSETCLSFCDKIGTISDPLSWLLIQHDVILINAYGDSDYRPWRTLGELSTVIFALGLHRPKEFDSSVPLYLQEVRRRVIAGAFLLDKQLATVLGRPPRIAWQYCDIQMPLDLPFDLVYAAFEGKNENLESMMKRIGPDGWNIDGEFNSGTQARLFLVFAIMREKILALSLSPHPDNMAEKIAETCAENDRLRSTLPQALQWRPNFDMTNFSEEFLANIHLELINNDFILYRALFKRTGDGKDKMLKVARQMLNALLVLVARTVRVNSRYDTIWNLCFIGLPCAGVLAQELLRRLQSRSLAPPDVTPFPRSEVIQNLSVFASHLDSSLDICDANHDIAVKGLSAIRNVLDHVLSGDHDFARPASTNSNNNDSNDRPQNYGDIQDRHAAPPPMAGGENLLAAPGIHDGMGAWASPSAVPGWFLDDVSGMEFMNWLDNLDWGQESLLSYG